MVASLEKTEGKKLVIVRYERGHNPHVEWVYNGADIDNAKIVWARQMTLAQDKQLIEYFKGRQTLLLNADAHPPKLTPYSAQVQSQRPATEAKNH